MKFAAVIRLMESVRFLREGSIAPINIESTQSLNWLVFCRIWPSNGVVPVVTEVVL